MVPETEEKQGQPVQSGYQRPFYLKVAAFVLGVAVVIASIALYFFWYESSSSAGLPPVTTPRPWVYQEQQEVKAVLLWDERILKAPKAGTIQFASGQQVVAVAKGDAIASLVSIDKNLALRSTEKGLFLPWIDGQEGQWTYRRFWQDTDLVPEEPKKYMVQDLAPLNEELIVGKILPTPQRPRAVFYASKNDKLMKSLKSGKVELKFSPEGESWQVPVRVWMETGTSQVKVSLELPMFPEWLVQHRVINLMICSGEEEGVLVPDSAVVTRKGQTGVYELLGNSLVWRPVEGWPVRDQQFFVHKGLELSNPIVINGSEGSERRVDLY